MSASGWRPGASLGLLLTHFAIFGLVIGVQGALWPNVIATLHTGFAAFGELQATSPVAAFVTVLLAQHWRHRVRAKRAALCGLTFIASGLDLLALANRWWAVLAALVLQGVGAGLLHLTMYSAAIDWERSTRRLVMNWMEATFSLFAAVGATCAGLMITHWHGNYNRVLVGASLACFASLAGPLLVAYPPRAAHLDTPRPLALTSALRNRLIICLAAISIGGTVAESVADSWSAIYLKQLGEATSIAATPLALFQTMMIVGRAANAVVVRRIGFRFSLLVSGSGLIVSGILFIPDSVTATMFAFGVLGLATAGIAPTVRSAAPKFVPSLVETIPGVMLAVTYGSFIGCPVLIGWLAQWQSLHMALGIILCCGVATIVLVLAHVPREP
jgi:fucose permease